jgi:hypothetical protein
MKIFLNRNTHGALMPKISFLVLDVIISDKRFEENLNHLHARSHDIR